MTDKLGIYIHIPFCKKKCNYCDFVSGCFDYGTQKEYIECILSEIEKNPYIKNKCVDTIFIGGGTPSVIEHDDIGRILDKLSAYCIIESDAEISMESNPGTLTTEKLKKYKEYGINRLSMGLQSTDDSQLKKLGRIHTYDQFLKNYYEARNVGFENINVDLMSAIPGQDIDSFADSLINVKELKPEHISIYSLIIEEGTPFYSMELDLCDEEDERKMVHIIPKILGGDYSQYEISNYSKKGYECKHNIKYWQRKPYVGFGIAAASLIGDNEPYNIRYKNTEKINEYITSVKNINHVKELKDLYDFNSDFDSSKIKDFNRIPLSEYEILSKEDMMSEYMILSLRMNSGASKNRFLKLFNEDMFEFYKDIFAEHLNNKLLALDKEGASLTEKGRDVCNYVLKDFM